MRTSDRIEDPKNQENPRNKRAGTWASASEQAKGILCLDGANLVLCAGIIAAAVMKVRWGTMLTLNEDNVKFASKSIVLTFDQKPGKSVADKPDSYTVMKRVDGKPEPVVVESAKVGKSDDKTVTLTLDEWVDVDVEELTVEVKKPSNMPTLAVVSVRFVNESISLKFDQKLLDLQFLQKLLDSKNANSKLLQKLPDSNPASNSGNYVVRKGDKRGDPVLDVTNADVEDDGQTVILTLKQPLDDVDVITVTPRKELVSRFLVPYATTFNPNNEADQVLKEEPNARTAIFFGGGTKEVKKWKAWDATERNFKYPKKTD